MIQVDLQEVVDYLRELLDMSKGALLKEANFQYGFKSGKMTKVEIMLFALERKFDSKVMDPTVTLMLKSQRGPNYRDYKNVIRTS